MKTLTANNSKIVENFKNFVFEVGCRYKNREGWYEVVKTDKENITVIFDNGNTKVLNKKIAERICFNLSVENEKVIPNTIKSEADFFWTIGALSNCEMRAEILNHSKQGFLKEYFNCSGKGDSKYIYVINNTEKWGSELRIDVTKRIVDNKRFCLPNNVSVVKGYNSTFNINNNCFCWHLIKFFGFYFDSNNKNIIVRNIPEKYLKDFEDGKNLI